MGQTETWKTAPGAFEKQQDQFPALERLTVGRVQEKVGYKSNAGGIDHQST
jgi:hypothetical protein